MREQYEKLQTWLEDDQLMIAVIIVVVAVTSFGLGRLSGAGQEASQSVVTPVSRDTQPARLVPVESQLESETTATQPTGEFVASRNGTKYHLLTCPGAKQMSEQNKIYFSTKQEAEASGYQPAANCSF